MDRWGGGGCCGVGPPPSSALAPWILRQIDDRCAASNGSRRLGLHRLVGPPGIARLAGLCGLAPRMGSHGGDGRSSSRRRSRVAWIGTIAAATSRVRSCCRLCGCLCGRLCHPGHLQEVLPQHLILLSEALVLGGEVFIVLPCWHRRHIQATDWRCGCRSRLRQRLGQTFEGTFSLEASFHRLAELILDHVFIFNMLVARELTETILLLDSVAIARNLIFKAGHHDLNLILLAGGVLPLLLGP
mmetsp:Transcript_30240/g.66132  ORF Transcript_30240/g.66132 Transcript_30240/m.66132 type:complete len:243 (-) Transcript_30240:238-966(-)